MYIIYNDLQTTLYCNIETREELNEHVLDKVDNIILYCIYVYINNIIVAKLLIIPPKIIINIFMFLNKFYF